MNIFNVLQPRVGGSFTLFRNHISVLLLTFTIAFFTLLGLLVEYNDVDIYLENIIVELAFIAPAVLGVLIAQTLIFLATSLDAWYKKLMVCLYMTCLIVPLMIFGEINESWGKIVVGNLAFFMYTLTDFGFHSEEIADGSRSKNRLYSRTERMKTQGEKAIPKSIRFLNESAVLVVLLFTWMCINRHFEYAGFPIIGLPVLVLGCLFLGSFYLPEKSRTNAVVYALFPAVILVALLLKPLPTWQILQPVIWAIIAYMLVLMYLHWRLIRREVLPKKRRINMVMGYDDTTPSERREPAKPVKDVSSGNADSGKPSTSPFNGGNYGKIAVNYQFSADPHKKN